MDSKVIILATTFFGISAFPFEPYSGVQSESPQPLYWVGSPPPGQFPASYGGTFTPHISSFYRNAPPAASALIDSPPANFAQYKLPSPVTAFGPDVPSSAKAGESNISGYPLLSPPSAATILGQRGLSGLPWHGSTISANGVAPTSGAIPELKIENSIPLDSKIPPAKPGMPLESTKENTKEPFKPRVTIFAPASLIGSDLIQTIFGKSFEESGPSIFIYAPGSLFITQDETISTKSSFLGSNNLTPESLIPDPAKLDSSQTLSSMPVSLLEPKTPIEALSEIHKPKSPGKGQERPVKEENRKSKEEDEEEEGEEEEDKEKEVD